MIYKDISVPVLVSRSEKKLQRYLFPLSAKTEVKNRFLCLAEIEERHRRQLADLGFSEIVPAPVIDDFRKNFLREYINLIGAIGRECHGREWWATDLSSKNRFASRIPELLQKFLSAVEIIEKKDYDHLIILHPPWVIVSSLKQFLRERRITFAFLEDPIKKWIEIERSRLKARGASIRVALKTALRKFHVQKKLPRIAQEISKLEKSFYVVKTFIYDHSFSDDTSYRDVFFGSLPDYLKQKRDFLIFANILGDYRYCVEKISQCRSYPIFPIESFLSYGDILGGLIRVLWRRIHADNKLIFFGHDVSSIINNELFHTHNGIQFYQYAHYWSMTRLLKTVSVDTFLLTHENNPWEKMCILAVRKHSPKTSILGYQHTVVPQASANMFISGLENEIMPMPDRILTVGQIPKEIMERYGTYKKETIFPSCGLRFEYLFRLPLIPRKPSRRVLVVLEGIFEVYKMVNYVIKEMKDNENYEVKIRSHPMLPMKAIQKKLICPIEETLNLRLSSQGGVKDDIEWADIVMYWGSTVALEALMMGKPIVHYETGSVLSYDPLFECRHFKRVVSEHSSLEEAFHEIFFLDDEAYAGEQRSAKSYLDRYLFPITDDRLNAFLYHRPQKQERPKE